MKYVLSPLNTSPQLFLCLLFSYSEGEYVNDCGFVALYAVTVTVELIGAKFENRVLRRIFGSKRDEMLGEIGEN
jgi:hypothetical protein